MMPIWTREHWVDKEEGTDFVTCLICGHQARKLEYHIKEVHGLSATDYRFQCGRYALLECTEFARQRTERVQKKTQLALKQGTYLCCPVCKIPLKNQDGIIHHMQHLCKRGSPEHLAWRTEQEALHPTCKTCKICGVVKPLDNFGKAESCRDGHRSTCSTCTTDKSKRANPTRIWETCAKYKRDPETKAKARNARLLKDHGITLDEYQQILAAQEGKCAICGATDNGISRWGTPANFHVDHDHTTRKVRGLLCFLCNKGVGMFRDNPTHMEHAAEYIRKQKH